MEAWSRAYGRLISSLAMVGCFLLLAMMIIIVADVLMRNLALTGWPQGLAWSNEVSELMLYVLTMCLAPWLLRQGQHIRVDIVLTALPKRWAWVLEWCGDVLSLCCCLVLCAYGLKATWASCMDGALSIKTLVTPEWWSLIPLPITFGLLAIECVFRMHRLAMGERGPRADAVSAS